VLPEKKEFFTPTEPIEVRLGETVMTLFPDEQFKITCTSADKKGRFTQFYSTEVTPKTWEKTWRTRGHSVFSRRSNTSSRTASSRRHAGKRRGHPRRRGADDRAAAVSGGFVRHKMLDIVATCPARQTDPGHVIAVRPGHPATPSWCGKSWSRSTADPAQQTFAPPPAKDAPEPLPAAEGAMGIEELMKFLPHRPPFLLVDRILKIEGNKLSA